MEVIFTAGSVSISVSLFPKWVPVSIAETFVDATDGCGTDAKLKEVELISSIRLSWFVHTAKIQISLCICTV